MIIILATICINYHITPKTVSALKQMPCLMALDTLLPRTIGPPPSPRGRGKPGTFYYEYSTKPMQLKLNCVPILTLKDTHQIPG